MSAFNGIVEPGFYGEGSQVCSECGEEFPEIDEATELCDACFEHIFGEPHPDEAALSALPLPGEGVES